HDRTLPSKCLHRTISSAKRLAGYGRRRGLSSYLSAVAPRCDAIMSFEPIISLSAEDPADGLARLGAVLVESGAVDRRTLERAGRVAAETGGRLDHVLTQLGLVSERGLAEALAQLLGAPLVAI